MTEKKEMKIEVRKDELLTWLIQLLQNAKITNARIIHDQCFHVFETIIGDVTITVPAQGMLTIPQIGEKISDESDGTT